MAQPFIGQIQMFAFPFAPQGYALCQAQLLSIAQNQSLFKILGTRYGGDGKNTFRLPDLRGRVPFQTDKTYPEGLAGAGGTESHTLKLGEMAAHSHSLMTDATTVNGTVNAPAPGVVLGNASGTLQPSGSFNVAIYGTAAPTGQLNPNAIGPSGGSQPHSNMMPYITINYSIALGGLLPQP